MAAEPSPEPRSIDVRSEGERALDEAVELRERIARERSTARALAEYLEAARARLR